MGGAPKPLAVVPTLESQSGAPAASKNVATILMPDLLSPEQLRREPSLTQPSEGISSSERNEKAPAPPAGLHGQNELPTLDLGLPASVQVSNSKPAGSTAPRLASAAGSASMDVDFGGTRGSVATPPHSPGAQPQSAPHYPPGGHANLYQRPTEGTSRVPLVVGITLATLALAAVALYIMFAGKSATTVAPSTRAPESQTAMNACEMLRRRIYAGGAATGLSRDGWHAELWLRGQGGAAIDSSKIDVAAMQGADPASGSETGKLTAPREKGDEGLLIRLWGPTVQAAFDPQGTDALIKQADLAFEQTNAEAGALYLKCSHLPSHDVGIWFRGNDLTVTAASVLFAMGVYAEKPVIRDGALGAPGKSAFERVLKKVKDGRLEELDLDVQRYGGSIQPPPNKRGARIVFPNERMPDAVRLSRVLADRAGIEEL